MRHKDDLLGSQFREKLLFLNERSNKIRTLPGGFKAGTEILRQENSDSTLIGHKNARKTGR